MSSNNNSITIRTKKTEKIPVEVRRKWRALAGKFRYQTDLLLWLKNEGINTTAPTLRNIERLGTCSPHTLQWMQRVIDGQNTKTN